MEKMKVPYNYLSDQFPSGGVLLKNILADIEKLAESGEFTLGPQVREFEEKFAALCGVSHAIGINSGTDALILILKALGIGPGDEVITVPNSFIATANAILFVGARPVFVDVDDEYLMDINLVKAAITPRTKAILPVHLTGNPVFMPDLMSLRLHTGTYEISPYIIEDAAQAVDADINSKKVGSWGVAGEFSLHPLKNLNVWGDGGMVTTNSGELAEKIQLMRNHGLVSRDVCDMFAGNCRLHTIQAVVGLQLMPDVRKVSDARIKNAAIYDAILRDTSGVVIPPRSWQKRHVYHTYVIQVDWREGLVEFLADNGVETKIHYPAPIHLQKPYVELGYKMGDFPKCEAQAKRILSLPIHQYLTKEQIYYTAKLIRKFYGHAPWM
ncbi:MAG: DegT/DnrJ/EryC1/StrS family aminotransferase [Parcubacteria group bacterium]|nr:DegT/DnrJ/EryC1/StrS family aminotransferase [Parcubacteria group bacterium]